MALQGWIKEIGQLLEQGEASGGEVRAADDSIDYVSDEGYTLRLRADGTLECGFRADLEDIRILISGDTTEDLSEDELSRVAREELRPVIIRYRQKLIEAGFEERVESDHDQYTIVFAKPLSELSPPQACDIFRWCQKILGSG